MAYSMVNVDEIDGSGPGGAVHFVRRVLGAEAFGDQLVRAPAEHAGLEHDESETQQEEVNVIVRGSGVYRVTARRSQSGSATLMRFDPRRLASRSPVLTA